MRRQRNVMRRLASFQAVALAVCSVSCLPSIPNVLAPSLGKYDAWEAVEPDVSPEPLTPFALGEVHAFSSIAAYRSEGEREQIEETLRRVLRESNLFGSDASAPMRLEAQVIFLNQPDASLDFPTQLITRYVLKSSAGEEVFRAEIESEGEADSRARFGSRQSRAQSNALATNVTKLRAQLKPALTAHTRSARKPQETLASPSTPAPAAEPSRPLDVSKNLLPETPAADDLPRTALVIGNADYGTFGKLRNPVNDARGLSEALRARGFEVLHRENLGSEAMGQALADFAERVDVRKGVAFFYYAGHGLQVDGANYLVPVNAKGLREGNIRYRALAADEVLRELKLAGAHLSVVLLDACRDNPLPRSFRSGGRGLAVIEEVPPGVVISFATSPGSTAADGAGANSPYAASLLSHLGDPLPLEMMLKRVAREVRDQTGGKQVPWWSSSYVGEFSLSGGSN